MFPEKGYLKMRQGMGPQFVRWGEGGTLSSREDKIQVLPVFSCFGFSRLFYILPAFPLSPPPFSPRHPVGTLLLRKA